jgi:hypothetical protein
MSRTAPFVSPVLLLVLGACAGPAFKEPPAGSYDIQSHLFRIGDTTASLPGASVTKDFFPATNAQALLGRLFIDSDFVSVSPATVVLSNQLWTARFDASPTIIGRTIEVDGRRWTVVGIAPKGFDVPSGAQYWTPKRS